MIKYKFLNTANGMTCNKYQDGKKSKLNANEITNLVTNYINNGYRIIINGDNLVLKRATDRIVITNYDKLASNELLAPLYEDASKKCSSEGFVRVVSEEKYNKPKSMSDNKKKSIRSVLAASLFVAITGHFIMGTAGSFFGDKNPYEPKEEVPSVPAVISEAVEQITEPVVTIDPEEVKMELYRQKIVDFVVREQITLEQFWDLLSLMSDPTFPYNEGYMNEGAAFLDICFRDELTPQEKFMIVMIRENNTFDELDYMCAGCVGEAYGAGECYNDAYAVASTLLNRIHSRWYHDTYGERLYDQFMAPGQYEIELSGNYKKFLGRIDLPGYQAVVDAFYSKNSMHDWLEFRADWVTPKYTYETFVDGGNKYMIKLKPSKYVEIEEEEIIKEDVMKLILTKNIPF